MHNVLIDKYCIYFAGIEFICNAGTIKLSKMFAARNGYIPKTTQVLDGKKEGWGELCLCQMSILINTLVPCHS